MKFKSLCLLVVLSFFSANVLATEFVYRNLMANTLPSGGCAEKNKAIATASKSYNITRYSKIFCQSQGYGLHVEQVKNSGKSVCNQCSADQSKSQCHLEDVVVTCKRIKPGSVGMLPGKN